MSTIFYEDSMGDMDIIFAGGGTAACVAAGRLARADPGVKILLIEGGPNNLDNPLITTPAVFLSNLAPDTRTALFYKSKASSHLNDREAVVPMGGILGGGSSINFMMYTRAQGVDFDSWKTEGWTAKDMIPLCKKLETYEVRSEGHDMGLHGSSGPIKVSDYGYRSRGASEYMNLMKDLGFSEFKDLQDFESVDGMAPHAKYVSPEGKRSDAAHMCIHPLLQDGEHPNLHLLVESKVVRVLFDESSPPRAVGVEYIPNEDHQASIALSKPVRKTIKANKLVVVSAGALGTPQILERSGVGNAETLKKLNIPVVSDLPGVGENYQDHHLVLYPYKTTLEEDETLDGIFSGRKDFAEALAAKDPILGWNGIDAAGKVRMTAEEAQSLGPEFLEDWKRDFEPYPTKPVMLQCIVNAFLADPRLVEPGQYVTLCNYTAYPYSRGSIHITSSEDCVNGYDFDAGLFRHASDVKKQVFFYKKLREVARRLCYITEEVELGHPKFAHDSHVAAFTRGKVGELEDLVYSEEDDAVIEDWLRSNVNTTWHSLGTCAMRAREEGGVVDGSLNVYGTVGLKVTDLSMVPENVGANTNNTALVIGEKAAVIIGREVGIDGV